MMITKVSGLNYCPKAVGGAIFKGANEPEKPYIIKDVSDPKVGEKKILTFKDPKYAGLSVLITPETVCTDASGSQISFKGVSAPVSFGGQVWGSIANNEKGQGMARAYDEFFDKNMKMAIQPSLSAGKIKDDYNFFVPSDGDGTRYRDIATLQGGMTKPASFIPAKLNGEPMRLIHGILANFSKTGKLENDAQFVEVEPAKGSAFALLEGLKNGNIPTDKPIVFSWGDNFSDIDISKLILEHEKQRGEAGNSGMTIIAIPVDEQKVRALSAMKLNNFEDKALTNFVEKPQGDVREYCFDELEGQIPSAVGPYIIAKPVLQWLKEEYSANPDKFEDKDRPEEGYKGKGFDFSSKILTPLVEEFDKGTFKDENGNSMKMRAKIIEKDETWSDLGAQKDFSFEMYRIKAGTAYHNMLPEIKETIASNIDDRGNIAFNEKAQKLLSQVQQEYGLTFENAIVWAG